MALRFAFLWSDLGTYRVWVIESAVMPAGDNDRSDDLRVRGASGFNLFTIAPAAAVPLTGIVGELRASATRAAGVFRPFKSAPARM